MKNGILLLCVLSLCAACTATSKAPSQDGNAVVSRAKNPEAAWAERQRVFAQMQRWQLNGRVGLQLRDQSWSFGLDWTQQGNNSYAMNINNPLTGGLMATVLDTGSQVTLKAADGKVYQDTDAERLLARQLKMSLPLKNLQYWARGVPSPGVEVDAVKLDAHGRPTQLQQAGWVIAYPAYQGEGSQALPDKILLEQAAERVKAKLVAKQWKTGY